MGEDDLIAQAARAIMRASGVSEALLERYWPGEIAHYREMVAKHGARYANSSSTITDAMRASRASLEVFRAAAPGPDRGEAERLHERDEALSDVLAGLSSFLGAGLPDDPQAVTPDNFDKRIRWGIDALTAPLVKMLDEARKRAAAAEARAERAEGERDEARDLLRRPELEWATADIHGDPHACAVCGGFRDYEGHASDCALAAQIGGPAREGPTRGKSPQVAAEPETESPASADPAAAGRADTSLRCPAGYVQDGDACPACGADEDGWCRLDPSDPRNGSTPEPSDLPSQPSDLGREPPDPAAGRAAVRDGWAITSPQTGHIIVSSIRSTRWAVLLCWWRDYKLSGRGFRAAGYGCVPVEIRALTEQEQP